MSTVQFRLLSALRKGLFPSEEAVLAELKTQNRDSLPVETGTIIVDEQTYEYSLSDFEDKVCTPKYPSGYNI